MTVWSAGDAWEPSGQAEPSLWGGVDASVGWPDVILAGVLATDRVRGVTWTTGRAWWLADPEPGTASIELAGPLDGGLEALAVGDDVTIAASPLGDLWHGTIDSIRERTEPQDGELARGVTITASDRLSRVLSAVTYGTLALPADTLDARLVRLALAAGVTGPQVVTILPTTGKLPELSATTLTGSASSPASLGDHLAACERASNAIVGVSRTGGWLVLPRARLAQTPDVVTLDPNGLDRALATPERVRNAFTIAGAETLVQTSIARYGRRAYDVPAGVSSTPPPYAPETLAALAEPAPFASATVPFRHRTNPAVLLDPFAFVRVTTRPDDELYQALALSWRAAPDAWELSAELDRTQMSIAAPPDPEVPEPEPPPPPPTTATATDTFACDRSAYIVRTPGGLNTGNGGSVDLLVGLLNDGNLARSLVRCPITWRGRVVRVVSAKLRLRVGAPSCASYGSSPSVTAYRATSSWVSGSYSVRCGFATSNAVVWPGPNVTSTGKVTRSASRSEGALWEANVTAIVQAWADGSPNYGFELRGASETSTANRVPFWSRNASSADRPELVVTYEYEVS